MANLVSGKVWSLDSVAGIVSSTPVCIHSIVVNWSSASAGLCVLEAYRAAPTTFGEPILTAYTLTAGTAYSSACLTEGSSFAGVAGVGCVDSAPSVVSTAGATT